jgi:FdhD protein
VVTADPADATRIASLAAALPPAGADRRAGWIGWRRDRRSGQGPLAGIEAALAAAAHDIVVVVAGDHPRVAPAVLAALVDRLVADPAASAVVLATDRGPQPLVAAYRREVAGVAGALLDAGERRATRLLDHLTARALAPPEWRRLDPAGGSALDVDTPADLRAVAAGPRPEGTPSGDSATDGPPDDAGDPVAARRTARVSVARLGAGPPVGREHDTVVVEEPLEIRACGPGQDPVVVATTLRTPGHDEELAVGWLHAEGLAGLGDVLRITSGDPVALARPDDQVTVHLRRPLDRGAVVTRHAVATASCGVCGRATIDALAAWCAPVPADVPRGAIAWSALAALPGRLRAAQPVFAVTGGLHAAAVATCDGELVTVREDVGRHNALDAAIGTHVLAGDLPLHEHVGVLSGRAGFELVAKAAAAGLPVLAAVGAPTDLAVRTADRLGITLVAFLREGAGSVFTHPHRLAPTR